MVFRKENTSNSLYGIVAEFSTPRDLFHACEKIRDEGYKIWDAHTPFPVHGLEKAMGLKPSRLPWIVLVMGLTGCVSAMGFQLWTMGISYPMVISGKPLFSWQAFMPVTFEVSVLLSAFGAVFGMLGLNKLPQHYHPLFSLERFQKATDDTFFIAIESSDPKFHQENTHKFLESLGATHVQSLEH